MITKVGRLIVTRINAIHRLVTKLTKKIIMHISLISKFM